MKYKKLTRVFDANGMPKPGEVRNGYRWNGMTWVPEQKPSDTTATQPQQQSTQPTANATQSQPTATQAQPNPNNQGMVGPTLVDFEAPVNNQAQQAANTGSSSTVTPPPHNPDTVIRSTPQQSSSSATQPTQQNAPQSDTSSNPYFNPVSISDLRKNTESGYIGQQKNQGFWNKAANKILGGWGSIFNTDASKAKARAASKYYQSEGMTAGEGVRNQAIKKGIGYGLGAMLGGLPGAIIGGRFINGNNTTSTKNAKKEGEMRTALANHLAELKKARTDGRISQQQYESMRNNAMANSKAERARIHELAKNGRSIFGAADGASGIGNFFRKILPGRRNVAANSYIDKLNADTKWLQQQKAYQYDNSAATENMGTVEDAARQRNERLARQQNA